MKRGHIESVLMSIEAGDLVVYPAEKILGPGLITKILNRNRFGSNQDVLIEILWSDSKSPTKAGINTLDVTKGWVSFILR